MSTNTRNGAAFSQMPVSYLEQTWRWNARRELCVEIRLHPYICLTQASLSLIWLGCRESIDGCRMSVKFGDAVLLGLISSSFFFYWRRRGICSDFRKRKGQLGKELQTHKRGGRRPCIPHGLSIDFIPLHSLVLFFSLLFRPPFSSSIRFFIFLGCTIDREARRKRVKRVGWIRWPRRNKRSEKGGKSRMKSKTKRGTFGKSPRVYGRRHDEDDRREEYVRWCRCRQLSYEAASLSWDDGDTAMPALRPRRLI